MIGIIGMMIVFLIKITFHNAQKYFKVLDYDPSEIDKNSKFHLQIVRKNLNKVHLLVNNNVFTYNSNGLITDNPGIKIKTTLSLKNELVSAIEDSKERLHVICGNDFLIQSFVDLQDLTPKELIPKLFDPDLVYYKCSFVETNIQDTFYLTYGNRNETKNYYQKINYDIPNDKLQLSGSVVELTIDQCYISYCNEFDDYPNKVFCLCKKSIAPFPPIPQIYDPYVPGVAHIPVFYGTPNIIIDFPSNPSAINWAAQSFEVIKVGKTFIIIYITGDKTTIKGTILTAEMIPPAIEPSIVFSPHTLISKDLQFIRISLAKIDASSFICSFMDYITIYFRKLNTNDLQPIDKMIKIRHKIGLNQLSVVAFGTPLLLSLSVSFFGNNISVFMISLTDKLCIDKNDHQAILNTPFNYAVLSDYDNADNSIQIIFRSKDPLNPLSNIELNQYFPLTQLFTFTIPGIYQFTFNIQKTINEFNFQSGDCDVKTEVINICYPTCLTCFSTGTGTLIDSKCLTCQTTTHFFDQNRCIPNCGSSSSTYFINAIPDYVCTELNTCTVANPFLVSETKECIITRNNKLVKKSCPIVLPPCQPTEKILISSNNCNCSPLNDYLSDLVNIVDDPSYILDLSQEPTILNNQDATYDFYQDSRDTSIIKPSNISEIIPGELSKLRAACNIQSEEPIIIKKVDTKRITHLSNQVKIDYFFKNGTLIDCGKCNYFSIYITVPINDLNSPIYRQILEMKEKGIDITDPNHPFFTDFCFQYDTGNNTDMTQKDRIKMYMVNNATLCPSKCSFKGLNEITNEAICSCDSTSQEKEDIFESIKNTLLDSLMDANWEVVLCYKLVFNNIILPKNIGSWFTIGMTIASIGSVVWIIYGAYQHVLDYIKEKIAPPGENTQSKLHPGNVDNGHIPQTIFTNDAMIYRTLDLNTPVVNNVIINNVEEEPQNEILQIRHKPPSHDRTQSNVQLIPIRLGNPESQVIPEIQVNPIVLANPETQTNPQIQNNFDAQIQSHAVLAVQAQAETQNQKEEKSFSYDDYDDMEFDELMKNDKRNILQHYWGYLRVTHEIINVFFIKTPKTPSSIKLSLFVVGFVLDFAVSAFFYSDKYISKNYTGESDFVTDLPVSIYSFLVNTVIGIALGSLSNSESGLDKLKDEEKPVKKIEMTKKFIKCYKIKLGVYIGIKIILLVGLWYYTASFCAVYQHSQVEWLTSGFISLAIGQIFPFISSILFTLIIEISLRWKSPCFFKIVKLIDLFFSFT